MKLTRQDKTVVRIRVGVRACVCACVRDSQAAAGGYAGWDLPASYSSVALMNADLGIYDRASGRCTRDDDLYDAVQPNSDGSSVIKKLRHE